MARRYQVTESIPLGTPSDPNTLAVQGVVDLPLLLSQRLQKNIRQGRVINIHSVKASIDAPSAGNLDLGGAVVGELRHCQATNNSAKAWRHLFAVWRKQKSQQVEGVGPMVRYDDFELGYNSSFLGNNRISTVYASGINDAQSEHVVLYGASSEGSVVTLEDTFESMRPQPSPSRFPLSNAVGKESKFTSEFPPTVISPFGASWSAQDNQVSHDSGAQVQQPTTYIQDSASLCGLVYYQAKLLPENVGATVQDDLVLELTFTVSIGSSLATIPSRKNRRMSSYKWTSHNRKSRKWKTYRKRGRK